MRASRRHLIALTLLALAVPAPAVADTAFEADVSALAVEDNRLVWSAGDRVMTGFGSDAVQLPIEGGAGGFDLGTDVRGRELLVYTRCPTDLCELFSYRFADGRIRRLPFSRRECFESSPSIHAGTIAFVRGFSRPRPGRAGCTGGVYVVRPGRAPRRLLRSRPWGLDLGGRRLAIMQRAQRRARDGKTILTSEIRTFSLSRPRRGRLIARARRSVEGVGFDGDVVRLRERGTSLARPTLDRGFVYWRRDSRVSSKSQRDDILRRDLGERTRAEVLSRPGRLYARPRSRRGDGLIEYGVDGDSVFYSFFPVDGRASLARVEGAPSYRRAGTQAP